MNDRFEVLNQIYDNITFCINYVFGEDISNAKNNENKDYLINNFYEKCNITQLEKEDLPFNFSSVESFITFVREHKYDGLKIVEKDGEWYFQRI